MAGMCARPATQRRPRRQVCRSQDPRLISAAAAATPRQDGRVGVREPVTAARGSSDLGARQQPARSWSAGGRGIGGVSQHGGRAGKVRRQPTHGPAVARAYLENWRGGDGGPRAAKAPAEASGRATRRAGRRQRTSRERPRATAPAARTKAVEWPGDHGPASRVRVSGRAVVVSPEPTGTVNAVTAGSAPPTMCRSAGRPPTPPAAPTRPISNSRDAAQPARRRRGGRVATRPQAKPATMARPARSRPAAPARANTTSLSVTGAGYSGLVDLAQQRA